MYVYRRQYVPHLRVRKPSHSSINMLGGLWKWKFDVAAEGLGRRRHPRILSYHRGAQGVKPLENAKGSGGWDAEPHLESMHRLYMVWIRRSINTQVRSYTKYTLHHMYGDRGMCFFLVFTWHRTYLSTNKVLHELCKI